MVTEWGMSEKVGPMNVGDREDQIFLGRELVERREVSERMSQMVDEESRALLDGAYQRAKLIVTNNREKLDALALALLERETLDAEEITTVFEGRPLPEAESTRADEMKITEGAGDKGAEDISADDLGADGRKGTEAAKREPEMAAEPDTSR